ncbi:transaldolase family protein [Pengzhenrongella sicca]|uniref:Transaldolase family protein n=2 Tax=Pengzhenrongella sicca TaxID=2819238 RepID=A0A8A4ZGX3_9MICO|nr:transaldolase family protein [Pengzhenrongella sicca]
MTQHTPTVLWNDSADPIELAQAMRWGCVGATCNPVIAYSTIKKNPAIWVPRIREIAERLPTAGEAEIGWQAVKDMTVEAAAMLEDVFETYQGRNGRVSVQTDPRLHRDKAALVDQALEFHALAKNIIVKIPATKVGIAAMEEATYRGVSINATVSFTVPQAVAVGEAIERALVRREAEGLDVSTMGPVVTIMGGRLDDWLKKVVARDKLTIDPGYLEWAGVAALKRGYQVFTERGFRSRILSAAFRNHMQWSELIGGDLVVSPPFAWQQRFNASGIDPVARIDTPVDPRILAALEQIPDFVRAYEVDGMTTDEFEHYGSCSTTLRQFLAADADLDSLVRDIIVPAPLT